MRVPSLYSLLYAPPKPLVDRHLRLEVKERVGADGEVIVPLDVDSLHEAINVIRDEGAEAVRRLPPPFLPLPRPRARHRRGAATCTAGSIRLPVRGRAPRNPRVRAHQHHRRQRIPRPHRQVVHRFACEESQERPLTRPRTDHAVERRHHVGPTRRADPRPDAGIRPRRRSHRRGRSRQAARPQERHHLRHGRHHRQGRPHRERLAQLHHRLRDRRGHLPVQQARHRRRTRRQGPRHRPRGGRCWRRQHRPGRPRWRAQGGSQQRRLVPRPSLLRHRRVRADRHRRQPRSRLHQPLLPRGRRGRADPVPGRIEYAFRRRRTPRSIPAGRRPRRSCRSQRQHDPRHPCRIDLPWPRPQGLRPPGLRRQRPHSRRRHGPLARHQHGRRPAFTGPVLRRRPPPRPDRSDTSSAPTSPTSRTPTSTASIASSTSSWTARRPPCATRATTKPASNG